MDVSRVGYYYVVIYLTWLCCNIKRLRPVKISRSNSRSRSLQVLHQPTCWGRVWPGCRPSFGRNFTSKMWVLTKMVYLRPDLPHVPQHKHIYFFCFPHQKNMGKVSERIKFEGAQLLSAHGRGTGRANFKNPKIHFLGFFQLISLRLWITWHNFLSQVNLHL